MSAKLLVLFGLVAITRAGVPVATYIAAQPAHGWQQPQASHGWVNKPQASHGWAQAHEAPANYEFSYEVHDQHTGDIKRQQEHAHDGKVSGQYSLLDADGLRRVVEYTADDHNGFQATVRREQPNYKVPQHIVAAPAPQPHYIQPAQNGWQQPQASHGWSKPRNW